MMNTHLKYLEDTYADTGAGVVVRVGRDERGAYLVLDQTVFYPQGGGQPTDTGSIQAAQVEMEVSFVGFSEGEVLHYLATEPADFEALVGQSCELRVDQAQRLQHAKLHTGGHLIAAIIDAQRGPLRAVKGFHFADGPYVEFEGKPEGEPEPLLAALQAQIDVLIAEGAPVTAEMVTYDELKQRCWSIPSYLPEDKPLRVVTIGQMDAVPCGGTHVANLAELGSLSVLKMKSKKGNTKISYRVGGEA
ncbi:alanine--tRNA ligase-related protein [Candidatus Thiothrix sp. Deng01]|uniref:Alanine--tRNA ligase n=1 Tax=Candidatus Thiothrix phosphatis TaxID=3112415 RepID=A0ABU6D0Z2_9GAMM|nr:alanine--tRNA ligase-related protein [Candidatus Thiothrix sp. Deng01]MEB4592755.1 alanine--tRNA ligase-related protein [Candidatus Thiothrix sp. Deng01]